MLPPAIWQQLKGDNPESETPTDDEIRAAMSDKATLEKVRGIPELAAASSRLGNYVIVKAPSSPKYQGRVLDDVATESGKTPVDLMIELVAADGMEVWAAWPISMDDVHTVIKADFAMGGTDGFNLDREIPNAVHPRHYGTFPRIVGRFVSMDHLFSLEEAVRKVTHNPATVMGIRDRGLVQPGYWADLVVFNSAELMDLATGVDPYKRAAGIEYVLVNGKIALEKGTVKPAFAGKVLKRQ
jgi:N-acyl-D-aspartate/D-glutamate deacylase